MVYDTLTGVATNLGSGTVGRFSPDGTKMVWIARADDTLTTGEAWMITLATGERRMLGEGRLVGFVDDQHVGVTNQNSTEVIDLVTDDRETVDGIPYNPDFSMQTTPDGYVLREELLSDTDDRLKRWSLTDPASGRLLLAFDAYRVEPAGRGALAVATEPSLVGEPNDRGYRKGTVNVFLLDITSGAATFIATSPWAYANWPIAGNDRYIAWTDGYCDFEVPGSTRIYDRTTGQMSQFSERLWVTAITPDDVLVAGAFGPKELIDIKTRAFRFSLDGAGDTQSTSDYRYISAGQFGGHGGLCP